MFSWLNLYFEIVLIIQIGVTLLHILWLLTMAFVTFFVFLEFDYLSYTRSFTITDYAVDLNSELGNDHINLLTLILLSYKGC